MLTVFTWNTTEIWDACVDLIVLHALPICVVDFPAFRRILAPYKIALDRQGIQLNINRENIKDRIAERAQKIREAIIEEFKRSRCV